MPPAPQGQPSSYGYPAAPQPYPQQRPQQPPYGGGAGNGGNGAYGDEPEYFGDHGGTAKAATGVRVVTRHP